MKVAALDCTDFLGDHDRRREVNECTFLYMATFMHSSLYRLHHKHLIHCTSTCLSIIFMRSCPCQLLPFHIQNFDCPYMNPVLATSSMTLINSSTVYIYILVHTPRYHIPTSRPVCCHLSLNRLLLPPYNHLLREVQHCSTPGSSDNLPLKCSTEQTKQEE
jgi:hypothetical protein